jgi:general secretion pathway protein H
MKKKGFTLLELVVVLGLLGIMLAISFPRFRQVLTVNELKTATRKIVGLASGLRDMAIRDNKDYLLHVEIDNRRFWVDSDADTEEEKSQAREAGYLLPPPIRISDVWLYSQGKISFGEATIRFNRKGYAEKTMIHLAAADGDQMSLLVSPFLSEIKIFDGYVEAEQ